MTDHLHALPIGHQLGEYRIERVLGSGGFGITYYAWERHLNKPVAIKEYLPNEFALRTDATTVRPKSTSDAADYQWGLERFLDEARTLARFDHPHLNKVHRYFEANGTAYMMLEYIEGETLSELLRRESGLEQARLRRLLKELLSGLEEVHGAGFVHRDVKPGNIMLRTDGTAVLLDFGAARQAVGQRSKSITSILTPGYAPIEQYVQKMDNVGPWSDLYALGMVAYRCISGLGDGELPDAVSRALAHKGEDEQDLTPAAIAGKGRYDQPLLEAIDWAIKVTEGERPQDVAALRQALSGSRKPVSVSKVSAGRPDSEMNRPERKWTLPLLLLCVTVILSATGAGGWWMLIGEERSYWRDVACTEEAAVRAYIKRYPAGRYEGKAQVCLTAIERKRQQDEVDRLAAADEKKKREAELKRLADEKRKAEAELKRLADEKRKAEAELKRLAEEKRKAEAELKRLAEEKRKVEAAVKRQQEEADRLAAAAEERKREVERARLAEESRKAEAEARQKQEAAARLAAEEEKKKREAELKRLAEEKRKAEAELKELAEEKRKVEAAVKRQQEEADRLASAEEERKRKVERARLAKERRKAEAEAESRRKLEAERSRFVRVVGRQPSANFTDANGWTDLHYAAAVNLPSLAKRLLESGARVDVRLKSDGEPLTDELEATLRRFGRNFNSWHKRGQTPLYLAVGFNAVETATLLIERGAAVNAKDDDGDTPLHLAAWNNAVATATLLVERGAAVNAKDNDGYTPLYHAARKNAVATATLLVERGAAVNAKDNDGYTPLHYAAKNNAVETATLLIKRGASVNAKANNGWTPLHSAAWKNAVETATLLIKRGAAVNAKNNGGETPLAVALRFDADEVAALLRRQGGAE